jgi:ubiquinol-cytochrome c reductase cytochrome c subunit
MAGLASHRRSSAFIGVGLVLAASAAGAQQTAQSLGAPAGNVERGRKVYMQQLCYTCHGTIGQGGDRGSGPKIYPNPYPFAAFVVQVRKPRQVMPPYSDTLVSDQDLADMYHYLFSSKPSPAAKDIPLLKDF